MKKFIFIAVLIFTMLGRGFAQPVTKDDVEDIKSEITKMNDKFEKLTNKTVQFGLSIGYRYLMQKSRSNYEGVSISPVDSTLQLFKVDDGGFLLSTSVVFNPRLNTKFISDQIVAQIYSYVLEQNNTTDKLSDLDQSSRLLLSDIVQKDTTLRKNKSQVTIADLRLTNFNSESVDFNPILIYSFMYDLKSKIRTVQDKEEKSELKYLKRKIRRLFFSKLLIDYGIDRISINANLNLIEFSSAQQELTFNKSIDGGLGISYMINPHLYVGINWESFTTRQLQGYLKERVGKQVQYNGNVISSGRELDIKNDDFFINRNLNGISFKIIVPL